MRYHYIPSINRMSKIINIDHVKYWQRYWKNWNTSYMAGKNLKWQTHFEEKTNIHILYDLVILLLGIICKRNEKHMSNTEICI